MGNNQKIIARNLRLLMHHRKLRNSQIAIAAGITPQTISNILNPKEHKSTVAVATLIKIADYFRVPLNYFFILDMTAELLLDNGINELIINYITLTPEARKKINEMAEKEALLRKTEVFEEKRQTDRRNKNHDRRIVGPPAPVSERCGLP